MYHIEKTHCNHKPMDLSQGRDRRLSLAKFHWLSKIPSVKMRSFTIWFLFIISLIYEGHSEELCGLEPPKAGESCGGADGVEATEEDR